MIKNDRSDDRVAGVLEELIQRALSPLDLLPHEDLREKLIDLILNGEPHHHNKEITRLFSRLERAIEAKQIDTAKVVVFGGGTGLSNIIGGDCRLEGWAKSPFTGLKELFPETRAVVCVTDDGGSTGELIKDLPLIAIGDIRHVLVSSIQLATLQRTYQVSVNKARQIVGELAKLFNHRFQSNPGSPQELLDDSNVDLSVLPYGLREYCIGLVERIFADERLASTLKRPNCLGNLLVCAAIYTYVDPRLKNTDLSHDPRLLHWPISKGLKHLCLSLGASQRAVLPCTSTPSQLRLVYTNGVETTGESKSSGSRRGVPVESAHVDFCGETRVYEDIIDDIAHADILILAPGSLYSSIIPVFRVPGLAEAVRNNRKALKLLISNLWVQAGETDLSFADPERKFHVSDMIRAYERNIPGGVKGLFNEVLCLSLKDVPGSVIQSYAVEGKVPIYLDRDVVRSQGFIPVECGIYSKQALAERGVIQHDPTMVATAVKVLYGGGNCFAGIAQPDVSPLPQREENGACYSSKINVLPNIRYAQIAEVFSRIEVDCTEHCACDCYSGSDDVRRELVEIVFRHHDIPVAHLQYIKGVKCIGSEFWNRDQQWDNVFTFYDPADGLIKIRQDQFSDPRKLEVALLIALGESLLGNYAQEKRVEDVWQDGLYLGKVYHLLIRSEHERCSYFSDSELNDYLCLARMYRGASDYHYTRLINGVEGFTPPGLLMGLMYAWYLENRLATHIEYKMSVMRIPHTDLIPEQKRIVRRREKMIRFFRDTVFGR